MTTKNVMIIGSGGREHALAWALSRCTDVQQVFVAPGNAGTTWPANPAATGLQPRAAAHNVAIAEDDFPALVAFAQENDVTMTVIGPEAPLAAGAVDAFVAAGLPVFGPSQTAAQLESSKAFSKNFMREHNIPTADYATFTDYEEAREYISQATGPFVVKADGLAAGKGVLICDTIDDAEAALQQIMIDRAFGIAGDTVLIEKRISGREISVLAFCDGKTALPMLAARDHKRALDGDAGLNTGGMGAFAPTTDVPQSLIDEVMTTVIQPTLEGMAAHGIPYTGILYAGLMLTEDGPQVLEFNCRFGDPETQVILPLLKTDLLNIFEACINGTLAATTLDWHDQTCATVVAASPGYPESYPKGLPITGLDILAQRDDIVVFHAGTVRNQSGQTLTAGGRVLAVSALGDTLSDALDYAYSGIGQLSFEGMHYRRDIGRVPIK